MARKITPHLSGERDRAMSEASAELTEWVRAYLEQDEDIIVPIKKMWNEWSAAPRVLLLVEFTRIVLADDLVEEILSDAGLSK